MPNNSPERATDEPLSISPESRLRIVPLVKAFAADGIGPNPAHLERMLGADLVVAEDRASGQLYLISPTIRPGRAKGARRVAFIVAVDRASGDIARLVDLVSLIRGWTWAKPSLRTRARRFLRRARACIGKAITGRPANDARESRWPIFVGRGTFEYRAGDDWS